MKTTHKNIHRTYNRTRTRNTNTNNIQHYSLVSEYSEKLASYVHTDAHHDFECHSRFYSKNINSIIENIPETQYTRYEEDDILKTIIITHTNKNGKYETREFTIDYIINHCIINGRTLMNFTIGNNISRKYNVDIIHYQLNNYVITEPSNFRDFFGINRVFIIDSSNIRFLDGFKNTEQSDNTLYDKEYPFYILYNREMSNDPANKPLLNEYHLENYGYYLKGIYDIDTNDINYNEWDNSILLNNNMFYSKSKLTLTNKNKVVKLKIKTNMEKEKVYNILKSENTIKTLISEHKENKITANIAFIRKRSGDALQVLSTFDKTRQLSDNIVHNYPKMIISLDRLVLYYSLLMGANIGFTAKVIDKMYNCYLITFTNVDSSYTSRYYNHSRPQKGGKIKLNTSTKIYKSIKNRINKYNIYLNKMPNKTYKKHSKIDKSIIIPDIEEYLDTSFNSSKTDNQYFIEKINNETDRKNIITYVNFYNTIEYNKQYISKLIYEEYIKVAPISLNIDNEYSTILVRQLSSRLYYKMNNYNTYMKQIINYYHTRDTDFANYLRSIQCIIWIMNIYREMEDEKSFYIYNLESLQILMTPELEILYNEETNINDKKTERFKKLADIISKKKEYQDIYEQICYTSMSDLNNFGNIVSYTKDHKLNIYEVIKIIAEQAYKHIPVTADILTALNYEYNHNMKCTQEIEKMVTDINNIGYTDNIKYYKKAINDINELFRRTVETHLTWGLKIL